MSLRSFIALFLLVILIAAIDVYGKIWAITKWSAETPVLRDGFTVFEFSLHKNPGIAFDIPVPFFIIFPLSILICIVFAYFATADFRENKVASLAAIAVIIGALGNLIDRAVNGFTTDYLIFFGTSAINLSDALIVIGMLGFLWYHQNNPSQRTA